MRLHRVLSLALALALACIMVPFGAIGESAFEPNDDGFDITEFANGYDEIEVDAWVYWGEASPRYAWMLEKAVEFEGLFDNVKVNIHNQTDINGTIVMGTVAKNLPQLALVEQASVPQFETILEDLQSWLNADVLANYNQGLCSTFWTEDGRLLAVPFARSAPVMYVNATLLAENGLDASELITWDNVYDICTQYNEKTGKAAWAVYWDTDVWIWESGLYSFGGTVLDASNEYATFGKDYDYVGAKFLDLMQRMLLEGSAWSPYSNAVAYDAIAQKFWEGEVVMFLDSNASYSTVKNGADFDVTVMFQPTAIEEERCVTSGGANWVMIDSGAQEQKIMAAAFLEFIANDDNVYSFHALTGYVLCTYSALESEAAVAEFAVDPNQIVIHDQLQYATKRVSTPYWAEMYDYLYDKLCQFSLSPGDYDIYNLVDDMESKVNDIIADNAW